LHCLKKAEKVNEKVTSSLNDLYALLEGLKTEKLMASLIVFLKDKQPEASALHNSLLSYLDVINKLFRRMKLMNPKYNSAMRLKTTYSTMLGG
jgi:hypothetical protein